jgi:hypothetical protein
MLTWLIWALAMPLIASNSKKIKVLLVVQLFIILVLGSEIYN